MHSFALTDYSQIVQNQFYPETPFWEMLFNFHGNPPLLSIIHHTAGSLFPNRPVLFFDLFLPLLHVFSFLAFRKSLFEFGVKIRTFWGLILFLNPLLFIYFRYPFYSTFLFFLSTIALLFLSQLARRPNLIFGIAGLFSLASVLRSTWHPLFLLPFLFWLSPLKSWKTALYLFFCFLPALTWSFKNYLVIGQFTSSSWIGINLARGHLPWKVHSQSVDFVQPFSLPNEYLEMVQNEPEIREALKINNPYLSQNNLNNKTIPVISTLFLQSISEQFSLSWSLNTAINGFLIYFKSPGNEEHVIDHLKKEGYLKRSLLHPDWFDPIFFQDPNPWYLFFANQHWDPEGLRIQAIKRFTPYTLFYPILLLILVFTFGRLPKEIKAIWILVVFFTGIYITTDVSEANRMRMEIECLFYFLMIWTASNRKKLWPNKA